MLALKSGLHFFSATEVPKNGTSVAETKKPRPLFNANIPPKWWITCLFYAFITFGWILSQFLKIPFFGLFWCRFPSYMAKKPCRFTTEDGLKSKNARKQTSFKIQFYLGIHVTSDFQQFYPFEPNSPSPNAHKLLNTPVKYEALQITVKIIPT